MSPDDAGPRDDAESVARDERIAKVRGWLATSSDAQVEAGVHLADRRQVTDNFVLEIIAELEAARTERDEARVRLEGRPCQAKPTGIGGSDPIDCDWPFCGCDPKADRVLELVEDQIEKAEAQVLALRAAATEAMERSKAILWDRPADFDAEGIRRGLDRVLADTAGAGTSLLAREREKEREACGQSEAVFQGYDGDRPRYWETYNAGWTAGVEAMRSAIRARSEP